VKPGCTRRNKQANGQNVRHYGRGIVTRRWNTGFAYLWVGGAGLGFLTLDHHLLEVDITTGRVLVSGLTRVASRAVLWYQKDGTHQEQDVRKVMLHIYMLDCVKYVNQCVGDGYIKANLQESFHPKSQRG
jgi:hypothetical protein